MIKWVLLFFCFSLFANKIPQEETGKIFYGSSYKLKRKYYISELIGKTEGSFYVLQQKRKSSSVLLMQKYDETSLNLVSEKEFTLPEINEEKLNLKEIYIFGNRFSLLCTRYDRTAKIVYAYVCFIDLELTTISEPKEIAKVEIKNARQAPDFSFLLSKDDSKLLVQHNFPFEKYNNEKFSFTVYNSAFDVKWKKEIELPYKDKMFKVNDYILDDSCNVHILSQITPEIEKGDNQLKGVPNNNYLIISYFPKENKIKEMDINLDQKWVSSVTLDIAPSGDLVAAGFYSNTRYFSIGGTFYLRIDDTTRAVTAQGLKAFEKDFLLEFMPEKKVKKGKELNDFYFDHFLIREDGSALMVAEQYYMITNYYWDPYLYTYNYTYQYYYNDIILVNIEANGSISWTKKIPKKQLSANDGGYYSSYAFGSDGKKACIVFNDNLGNLELRKKGEAPVKTMFKPSKSQAIKVTVDEKGNENYQAVYSDNDDKLILRPKFFFENESGSLILMGTRASEFKFGKLRF